MHRRQLLQMLLGSAVLPFVPLPPTHAQMREKVPSVVPPQAALFPLENVRMLPGPFQVAQDTDRAYLLRLDPDRLLAWMRTTSGLTPKAPHYDGWDDGCSGTIGHYLSACSQMAQATGDPALRKRVDYIVAEMAACQQGNGDGAAYDSGGSKHWFSQIAAGEVHSLNTTPWYITHKTFAGIRDAWLICGSAQARDVLINMADWCITITAKLTDAQWQEMLGPPGGMGEFGGPHEVLADVYAITGDRKYLDCAEKFRHNIIFDPLLRGDGAALNGNHANTEIPKFVGYERIYALTGEKSWHDASLNFWNAVVADHSWANGGNSQQEHFFAPAESEAKMKDICGPESCNTYNMLKLTQELYTLNPDVRFLDFYERALYNHILSTQAPDKGGLVYYTSMRPGHYRKYSRPFDAFWCCVGTGMENHGKYGKMIYSHQGDDHLSVNLFIPSVLTWEEKGLMLRQETVWPQEPKTRLIVTLKAPRRMTIRVRCPGWMAPGEQAIRVNGALVKAAALPGSYADITRVWHSGDTVDIALPMQVRTEPLTDSADYAAFFYGPILLAGELGTEGLASEDYYGGGPFNAPGQLAQKSLPMSRFPTFTGNPAQSAARVKRIPSESLAFRVPHPDIPAGVSLVPFYGLHFQRYAIYWHFQSGAELAAAQDLEERTLDRVLVGETDSETAHHMLSDTSHTGSAGEPFTHWRDATGFFSYELKVSPDHPTILRCAYWGSDAGRTFHIRIDGKPLATQTLTGGQPGRYDYVTYPLPPEMTQGKLAVTVRFEAAPGSVAGGLFDIRALRAGN